MNENQVNFINSLIGTGWRSGAIGPREYDCWTLSVIVQKELFGRDMPLMSVDAEDVRVVMREIANHPHRKLWKRIDKPIHGALVEMTSGRHPFHIGTYLDIDGGGILHSFAPVGCTFDRVAVLEVSGWRRIVYNEWIG